ncbi:MAG: APC family permease [Pseudomonadota bacterium]
MKLERKVGKFSLLCMALGGMIGSGWLFGPYYAAKIAGPMAIFSWILGGVMMMFVALTFAELATLFPESGSMVRFPHKSHGAFVSSTMGWMIWLSSVAVVPIETLALLQYAQNYLPFLMQHTDLGYVLTHTGMLIAAIIMLIICILNNFGAHITAKSNGLLVLLKLLVPLMTAMLLAYSAFHISNFSFNGTGGGTNLKNILMALPMAGVIFSFIGYSPALQLAGEAKHPKFSVPLAIIGSLLFTILFYVFIQTIFIGALNPNDLTHGWAALSFKGDAGPFAGIAAALGLGWLVYVLYADAIFSPFGTAFIYTASTARINYGLAENGFFPTVLKNLNRYGAPAISILLNYIVGLFMLLPFPGWQSMVGFLVSAIVLAYGIGPLALIRLRQIQPETHRSFKLPCAQLMTLLAFYCCNLIAYWTGWHTIKHLLIMIAIGYILMLGGSYFRKQKIDFKLENGYWLVIYFIGLGMLSYLGSFGGGINLLPFGWDFLVIGLFCLIFFYWSKHSQSVLKFFQINLFNLSGDQKYETKKIRNK